MEPTIDSLLLADFAEVVNGKLYLMGGGFTAVQLAQFGQSHRFFVAAALRIPWTHTNTSIELGGRLETLDAEPLDPQGVQDAEANVLRRGVRAWQCVVRSGRER